MPRPRFVRSVLFFVVLGIAPAARADADPWVARDKALHFDVSVGVAALTYAVSAAWVADARWQALALGGGVTLAIGAAKEAIDASGILRGDPSWKDFAWDAAGAVVGLALAWGMDLLLGGIDARHPALAAPARASAASPLVIRF